MARIVRLAGLGAVACLVLLSPGSAQTIRVVDPYPVTVVTRPSPYWGYVRSMYAAGDYLRGAAALTRANADYHVRIQEASQEREKTRRMKLETRKAELEHVRWERNFIFEMREEERQRAV